MTEDEGGWCRESKIDEDGKENGYNIRLR